VGNEIHHVDRGILDGPSYPGARVQCECFAKTDLGKNGDTYTLVVFDTVKNG